MTVPPGCPPHRRRPGRRTANPGWLLGRDPRVHIQVGYADGEARFVHTPRVDPAVVIQDTRAVGVTSQSLGLSRNGFRRTHSYCNESPSHAMTMGPALAIT